MIDLFRRKRGHLPVHPLHHPLHHHLPQAHLRQKRGEEERKRRKKKRRRKEK